ncbi:uncharacterized protein LAESUDRAFT_312635 [Laetiporus sulphureus 93-53]|uniref:Uncharacterized protein n=1 Tax=Laetiporus sulphureus 93-53 TaxID=1314785 RepID=A0A165D585_9APHY|nr:uncharacterized protein LAESUDRAFT_312635 [Laetiporus sulphureus 93-53]KZT04177.1 hypothetical protein LAESUDRAFT_312635 [Laetiporus sulphureus 93-53]
MRHLQGSHLSVASLVREGQGKRKKERAARTCYLVPTRQRPLCNTRLIACTRKLEEKILTSCIILHRSIRIFIRYPLEVPYFSVLHLLPGQIFLSFLCRFALDMPCHGARCKEPPRTCFISPLPPIGLLASPS